MTEERAIAERYHNEDEVGVDGDNDSIPDIDDLTRAESRNLEYPDDDDDESLSIDQDHEDVKEIGRYYSASSDMDEFDPRFTASRHRNTSSSQLSRDHNIYYP